MIHQNHMITSVPEAVELRVEADGLEVLPELEVRALEQGVELVHLALDAVGRVVELAHEATSPKDAYLSLASAMKMVKQKKASDSAQSRNNGWKSSWKV